MYATENVRCIALSTSAAEPSAAQIYAGQNSSNIDVSPSPPAATPTAEATCASSSGRPRAGS